MSDRLQEIKSIRLWFGYYHRYSIEGIKIPIACDDEIDWLISEVERLREALRWHKGMLSMLPETESHDEARTDEEEVK